MQPVHNPLPRGSNPEWNPWHRRCIRSCGRLCSLVSASRKYVKMMVEKITRTLMTMLTSHLDPIVDIQERVTATSISQMLNNVGQGVNIIMRVVEHFANLFLQYKGELSDCQPHGR